uniref:Uncharacterized protein n=1 Tax=Anopheles merus TaxID=30066 RepID=A0A182V7M3_ANOME
MPISVAAVVVPYSVSSQMFTSVTARLTNSGREISTKNRMSEMMDEDADEQALVSAGTVDRVVVRGAFERVQAFLALRLLVLRPADAAPHHVQDGGADQRVLDGAGKQKRGRVLHQRADDVRPPALEDVVRAFEPAGHPQMGDGFHRKLPKCCNREAAPADSDIRRACTGTFGLELMVSSSLSDCSPLSVEQVVLLTIQGRQSGREGFTAEQCEEIEERMYRFGQARRTPIGGQYRMEMMMVGVVQYGQVLVRGGGLAGGSTARRRERLLGELMGVTSSAEVAAGGGHPAVTISIALALAVGVWSVRDWIAVEEEVEDDPRWVLLCMPSEEPLREPSPSVVPCSWWTEDREG